LTFSKILSFDKRRGPSVSAPTVKSREKGLKKFAAGRKLSDVFQNTAETFDSSAKEDR